MRSVVVALLAALAGCAAPPPPPPPPTALTLRISADAAINPGPDGRAAPLMLRVYQLASPAAFANADFFQLYNDDAKTLGADLVHRDDVVLRPGAHRDVALAPAENVHAVAVFAALREPGAGTWRIVLPVAAHKTASVPVTATTHGIAVPPPPKSS